MLIWLADAAFTPHGFQASGLWWRSLCSSQVSADTSTSLAVLLGSSGKLRKWNGNSLSPADLP